MDVVLQCCEYGRIGRGSYKGRGGAIMVGLELF